MRGDDVYMTRRIFSMLLALLMTLTMFGTVTSFASEMRNPYEPFNANTYDEVVVKSGSVDKNNGGLGGMWGGSYSVFKNMNFTTPPTMVTVESAANANYTGKGNYFEVRLDSVTGKLLGRFEPPNTGGWNTYTTNKMLITEDITGVHDIYIIATNNAACSIRNVVFVRGSEQMTRLPSRDKKRKLLDIENEQDYKIADTLISLGLTYEGEDGLYGVNNEFTIDEALKALSVMTGKDFENEVKPMELSDSEFFEMFGYKKNYNFNRYIETDPIATEDLCGLLLGTLGWLDVIDYMNCDIMTMSQNLKLFTGVSKVSADTILTKIDASRIIYNALGAKVLEFESMSSNGITYKSNDEDGVMAVYDDVYRAEGVVSANELTSLNSVKTNAGDVEVIVDGKVYKTGKTSIHSALGLRVEFFYKYDTKTQEKTILYYDVADNKETTISSEDLIKINSGSVEYASGTKTKSISYKNSWPVIYNSVAAQDYTSLSDLIGDLDTFKGSITIIDNGENELIKVESFKSIVMERFSDVSGNISDAYGNHINLKQNAITGKVADFKYTAYDTEGGIVDMTIFGAGTVVDVAASHTTEGNNYFKLVVPNEVIYGKITQIDADSTVTLAGTEYRISPEYFEAVKNGKATELAVWDEGDFYLDSFGNICAYVSGTRNIVGYIRDFDSESTGFNTGVGINMYTNSGEMLIGKISPSAVIDGYRIGADNSPFKDVAGVVDYFKSNYDKLVGTVASYRVNSKKEIYYLDTLLTLAENENDTMKRIYNGTSPVRMINGIIDSSTTCVYFGGGVAFAVPIPGTNTFSDEACYKTLKSVSAEHSYLDCYATDGDEVKANVVAVRGDYSQWAYDKLLIERISTIVLPDGETTHGVKGRLFGYAKKPTEVNLEFDSITQYESILSKTLKPGDVINLKYDLNGRIVNSLGSIGVSGASTSSLMFDSKTNTIGSVGRTTEDYSIYHYAEIVDINENFMLYKKVGSDTVAVASIKNSNVMCFDRSVNKISQGNLADLLTEKDNGEGTKVLLNINSRVAGNIIYYIN